MTKTFDDYFADWEAHTFGYGYGSGEPHTVPALKQFLLLCPMNGHYDYLALERALSPTVAWLLINVLAHAEMLDYGTSPRGAWLTPTGRQLKRFVDGKTGRELLDLTNRPEDHTPCYPDVCNCGPNGFQKGVVCPNPFFHARFVDAALGGGA